MDNFHSLDELKIQSQDGKWSEPRGMPRVTKSQPQEGQGPNKTAKWSDNPYKWANYTSVFNVLKNTNTTMQSDKI